jgi:hypothetical protein
LGFRNQQRFKVFYAEIPVTSSVLLMDSLSTGIVTNSLARMLTGKYVDPVFGTVEAKSFAQFRPIVYPKKTASDTFDSLILQVQYDFYSYGAPGKTTQKLSVHEITQKLEFTNNYFANSSVSYDPNPIGSLDVEINADYFKSEFEKTTKDSVLTSKFKLSDSFGQRLLDVVNYEDTLFTNVEFFTDIFKGLAIVPEDADKVVGLSNGSNTYLTLYYHNDDGNKVLTFSLSGLISFSQITSDRSGTELAGLSAYSSPYDQGPNRYIQNGTSIITKLDISEFYNYIADIPNVVINSAELSIENFPLSEEFGPPTTLSIAVLRANNHFKKLTTSQDTTDYLAFKGYLSNNGNNLLVAEDGGSVLEMKYSTDTQTYISYPTLFFQKLFELKQTEFPYLSIVSSNPPMGKSVNRVVFPKDGIKLKIYYTRPLITENP